jgi:hypothetical protein
VVSQQSVYGGVDTCVEAIQASELNSGKLGDDDCLVAGKPGVH